MLQLRAKDRMPGVVSIGLSALVKNQKAVF